MLVLFCTNDLSLSAVFVIEEDCFHDERFAARMVGLARRGEQSRGVILS
jgi:hypothetical protein